MFASLCASRFTDRPTDASVAPHPLLATTTTCIRTPACLAAAGEVGGGCLPPGRIVQASRPECRTGNLASLLCNRSVFETPSGVLATLPALSASELAELYAQHFDRFQRTRQGNYDVHKVSRLTERTYSWLAPQLATAAPEWSSAAGAPAAAAAAPAALPRPLHVVEMGCMHGLLLSRFNSSRSPRLLKCFEATPEYHPQLQRRFDALNSDVLRAAGGRAELVRGLFDGSSLEPASVDLFLSSHVIEHLSDPCNWLRDVWNALKPGGYIFSQVPLQRDHPSRGLTFGIFHLLYFDEASFSRLMRRQGFVQVAAEVDVLSNGSGHPLRGRPASLNLNVLHRKPAAL